MSMTSSEDSDSVSDFPSVERLMQLSTDAFDRAMGYPIGDMNREDFLAQALWISNMAILGQLRSK